MWRVLLFPLITLVIKSLNMLRHLYYGYRDLVVEFRTGTSPLLRVTTRLRNQVQIVALPLAYKAHLNSIRITIAIKTSTLIVCFVDYSKNPNKMLDF